jgi:chromosome segregation ATPase
VISSPNSSYQSFLDNPQPSGDLPKEVKSLKNDKTYATMQKEREQRRASGGGGKAKPKADGAAAVAEEVERLEDQVQQLQEALQEKTDQTEELQHQLQGSADDAHQMQLARDLAEARLHAAIAPPLGPVAHREIAVRESPLYILQQLQRLWGQVGK